MRRLLMILLAGALVIAACGDDDPAADEGDAETPAGPDDTADDEPVVDDATGTGVDLSGVCPDTISIQADWFPEAEYGVYFQLAGPGGETDVATGSYRAPLVDTGVDIEIRSGGPFLGQQTVSSLMYQDDSIFLGLVHTDDAIRFSDQLPTVSVVAPLERSPLALVWDPEVHDFESFEDIGESDATILVFTKEVNYVPFLIDRGIIPASSFDDSFDGSYSRFVADNSVVQQAFITETPFRLENEIADFGRPVDALLVADSGYDPYLSSLSIRADRFEDSEDCLELLVPLVQQAQVDYLADPDAANQVMVDMVTELDSFWTLSMEGLAFGNAAMLDHDIVSNGGDATLGNFDLDRVGEIIADFQDVFGDDVDTADPAVTPDQIVTNEFIDPSIGL